MTQVRDEDPVVLFSASTSSHAAMPVVRRSAAASSLHASPRRRCSSAGSVVARSAASLTRMTATVAQTAQPIPSMAASSAACVFVADAAITSHSQRRHGSEMDG